jgi:hypothetical protein
LVVLFSTAAPFQAGILLRESGSTWSRKPHTSPSGARKERAAIKLACGLACNRHAFGSPEPGGREERVHTGDLCHYPLSWIVYRLRSF